MKLKGIYLAAFKAKHDYKYLVYQDINGKRELCGDMMDIDLSRFDFIIATPPCNFYSIARGKTVSTYAEATAHLLPDIIDKLISLGKPFIVENVVNYGVMCELGLFNKQCYVFRYGRHTYWTNMVFDLSNIKQRQDFLNGGRVIKYKDMINKDHQGGYNVHQVIDRFITVVNLTKAGTFGYIPTNKKD